MPGLPCQDALRRGVEVDRLGPGLAVAEMEGVAVDFVPAQIDDFAPTAAGKQEEADDVGLGGAGRPFGHARVEMLVQSPDLVPREEARAPGSRIRLDGAGRVALQASALHGVPQDGAEQSQRLVGAAGCRRAVLVEPPVDILR